MVEKASAKIHARRERLRWTQAELARRAGLTTQTICNVEVGRRGTGSAETLAKIEAALADGEASRA